jgi:hypothetical protein
MEETVSDPDMAIFWYTTYVLAVLGGGCLLMRCVIALVGATQPRGIFSSPGPAVTLEVLVLVLGVIIILLLKSDL